MTKNSIFDVLRKFYAPHRRRHTTPGQALLEFALVLPIMLLIIFLLIEAALMIQGYLTAQHAAREAARWAIAYQPVQGYDLQDRPCVDTTADPPFLFTDAGNYLHCDPNEDTNEYNARRIALIKEVALQRAAGLRIDRNHLGLTEAQYLANYNQPGFFGVRVWGFPSFESPELLDHPGLPGLPVRVQVVHNVEIIDPLLRAITTHVRVAAEAEMVNEGIQVGFGNMPPPTFNPPPTIIGGGGTAVPTATPEGGPTATPVPDNTHVNITFDYALNQLPLDRSHYVTVTVTNDAGAPVPYALVSFSTDLGAFGYSGVSPQYIEEFADSTGVAIRTVYANEPGTAHLRAWLDIDGDRTWDPGEPHDEATKEWVTTGPYVLASNHDVLPLDWITVDIYDHLQTYNPYTLLWCRTSISGGIASQVVGSNINVDASGDYLGLPMEIPSGSEGYYRLETHTTPNGGCNASTMVAFSAEILVQSNPPDLHIENITYPPSYGDHIPPYVEVPIRIVVENLSASEVEPSQYFDIDYYLNPSDTPYHGQVGDDKQWLLGIGPYMTRVVTSVFTFQPGTYEMWGQVDTTNYVREEDETNNISGPFYLDVRCTASSSSYGDSFDDNSFASKWTTVQVGSPNVYGSQSESGDYLTTHGRGRRIWGNGSDENFYFIYQSISGDFDARLRVISGLSTNQWAKIGLMIRASTASNSRHVMLMYTRSHGLQFAYRPTDAAGNVSISTPVWVRIVRSGNTFAYYYSTATDPGRTDWTYRASIDVDMGDSVLIGIPHCAYSTGSSATGQVDEFVICQSQPVPGATEAPPPGLVECTQLLQVGGFEGNPDGYLAHWQGGDRAGAWVRDGYLQYEGAFAMRLSASRSDYPACTSYFPYIYQIVQVPSDVISYTHIRVEGARAVSGSRAPCSYANSVDADDELYVRLRDSGGNNITNGSLLADGSAVTDTWELFNSDFSSQMDVESYAGQNIQVYFYAEHDQDEYGTWFYLDDLETNACTEWPIPDPEPGTASIGGLARAMVQGVPQPLPPGENVWAYMPGGEVLHTTTIHDGTYHFYNIPPGTYTVYAETWVGNNMETGTTTVTVVADERNYHVNILLQ